MADKPATSLSPVVMRYEMGYTENEFAKVLQGDFSGPGSGYNCRGAGHLRWLIHHQSETFETTVSIRQGAPRKLGAMQLPVLDVEFGVTASQTQQAAFFDRFFKYFHKGGG